MLAVLLGNSASALAGFAPSFYLEGCTWNASHIVVVTEGDKIDGVVEVLESWAGDFEKGQRITIPELAAFAVEKKRKVSGRLFELDNRSVFADHVTCSRMILFLIEKQEKARPGVPAKVTWLPANTWWKQMGVSTVWIEKRQARAFSQQFNPGPSELIPWAMTECDLLLQVTDILKAKSSLQKALGNQQPDKLAAAVLPLIRSGTEFVREKTVEALGESGPKAQPALRKVLSDSKLARYHAGAIGSMAKAGGAATGAELTRILEAELAYWKAEGPRLKPHWWNGGGDISWEKVETLGDRYCKSLATIRCLGAVRHAGSKKSVKAFRDYWRSLPQLNEVSQMVEVCDEVIEKLG
jgi:hypothetical protein